MTDRRRRDREAERAALRAAADRLLAGTPLRSDTGRLTATELLKECELRRDVVYSDHKDLVEEFQAKARAQHSTPAAMQRLAEENARLKEKLETATSALAHERAASATLRKLVAELDLELQQAKEQLAEAGTITRLPAARRSHRPQA